MRVDFVLKECIVNDLRKGFTSAYLCCNVRVLDANNMCSVGVDKQILCLDTQSLLRYPEEQFYLWKKCVQHGSQ